MNFGPPTKFYKPGQGPSYTSTSRQTNFHSDEVPYTNHFATVPREGFSETSRKFINAIQNYFPEISKQIKKNKSNGLKSLIEFFNIVQNKKNTTYRESADLDEVAAKETYLNQKKSITAKKADNNLIFDGNIEKTIPKPVSDVIKHLGLSNVLSIQNKKIMAPHHMDDFEYKSHKISAYTKTGELKPLTNTILNAFLSDTNTIKYWEAPSFLREIGTNPAFMNRIPEIKILKSYISGTLNKNIAKINATIAQNKNPKILAQKVWRQLKKKPIPELSDIDHKSFISAHDFDNYALLEENLKAANIKPHKQSNERIQKELIKLIEDGNLISTKNLAKSAKYSKDFMDNYL